MIFKCKWCGEELPALRRYDEENDDVVCDLYICEECTEAEWVARQKARAIRIENKKKIAQRKKDGENPIQGNI